MTDRKKDKVAFHATSIYNIDIKFFLSLGIKTVVADLDNTLDAAHASLPREEAFLLKKELEEAGISLVVVSNNRRKRVSQYCEKLGVPYLASAMKFTAFKIRRFLKESGWKVSECIFVGDQLFTDCIYVNKLKGRLILTEPLVKKDQFVTRFVRGIDTLLRRRWLKKDRLGLAVKEKEDSYALQENES